MNEYFDRISPTEPITEFALALATETAEGWQLVGTAIAISRQLILTAKHAVQGIWKPHHLRREDSRSDSPLIAFQVLPGMSGALWYAKNAYFSQYTDLVLLDVFPYSESASDYKWRKVAMNFASPCVGQVVSGFGYCGGSIQETSDQRIELRWEAHPRTTRGRVVAIHHAGRDRGFCSFPCFEMSARTEPGMSGGPIFDEGGRLCGLVFGGGLERQDGTAITYGTLLWPLLALDSIKGRWEGEEERLFSFYQLVKRGAVAAVGLDTLEIQELEAGRLAICPRRPVA
jgi:hypothetical protein